LDSIDLDKVLIEPDDNFDGIYLSDTHFVDDITLNYWSVVQGKYQNLLSSNGNDIGGIMVMLFRSPSKQAKAYDFYSMIESQEGIIPKDYPNISDQSAFFATEYAIHSVFIECEALTSISISRRGEDTADAEIMWKITKVIHGNIKEFVCK
jgi:hypothetical protein